MNRASFAVLFSSLYFLVFLLAPYIGSDDLTWALFLFSPIIVLYAVYSVIRYGTYTGKELKEDEEWGYEDVEKEQLGTWG